MGNKWHRQERLIGIVVRLGVHRAWIQIRRSDLLLTVDGWGSHDLHRMAAIVRDLGDARGAITITSSPSNGGESSWKNSTIAARSNRDCGAIGPRSWLLQGGIGATILPLDRTAINWWPGSRSTHDRGAITVQSWPDCGVIMFSLKQKLRWIYRKSGSHDTAQGNCFHNPAKQLPRSHQTASKLGLILPLKLVYSPFFSLNLWSIHEGIKQISRNISSSSWSPTFRLDCEEIRAVSITNFSLISSNFPLEFRTSTRKNPRKFVSIHENWSPILEAIELVVRFHGLSGGNLSFY